MSGGMEDIKEASNGAVALRVKGVVEKGVDSIFEKIKVKKEFHPLIKPVAVAVGTSVLLENVDDFNGEKSKDKLKKLSRKMVDRIIVDKTDNKDSISTWSARTKAIFAVIISSFPNAEESSVKAGSECGCKFTSAEDIIERAANAIREDVKLKHGEQPDNVIKNGKYIFNGLYDDVYEMLDKDYEAIQQALGVNKKAVSTNLDISSLQKNVMDAGLGIRYSPNNDNVYIPSIVFAKKQLQTPSLNA